MLQLKNISKTYKTNEFKQIALDNVSLSFCQNEFVAILGPSGSGKTTLLNIIGGLDRYDKGDLIINGVSTKKYKEKDWNAYRNHTIGFVFQSYNLIPHQSVLANVELALTISNVSAKEKKKRATEVLQKVGLGDHLNKKPNQLSGGQMQRVAIARALVNNPDIILADEPTGVLDSKTSVQVMDLLKEVANDRLVIMVTHNPDLADQYATRIVNLKDGQIISDTMPYNEDSQLANYHPKKTKLLFTTALHLSFNNLLTKKGRTFLTSFAGAIGIIGIALILSLSNGVNAYISSLETSMLGSYPIEIEERTFDLSSMMAQGGVTVDSGEEHDTSSIYSNNVVADSVATTSSMTVENNLSLFKEYLQAHSDELTDYISAIEYGYDVTPLVYREDEEEGLVQVSPATLDTGSSSMMSGSLSSAWSQLIDNETMLEDQYELLAGEMPNSYDEVALIITEDNEISDYTLYTLGLMDISEMYDLIEKIENEEDYEDETQTFAYEDVIGLEYQVFATSQLYSETDGVYVDESDDEEYILDHLDEATTVTITCVLRASDDADISSGVGYTYDLTEYLMNITANSDVVKAQLADPDTNVLTGETFEEDEETDTAYADTNLELTSYIDGYNVSTLQNSYTTTLTMLENEAEDTDIVDENTESTDEATTETTQYTIRFLDYDGETVISEKTYSAGESVELPSEDPTRTSTDTIEYLFIGWQNTETNAYYRSAYIPEVSEDVDYVATFYEYYITPTTSTDTTDASTYDTSSFDTSSIDTSTFDTFSIDTSSIDVSSIVGSTSTNLTDDQLKVLMAQSDSSTPSTYEDVLEALGYVTEDDPSSISIYPVDFDSKDTIEDFIETYNNQVENESDQVTYTDIIATLTSSITSIVNTISYVLIAFVAISLVVSSIMIAIITYISVLERTKEIGVLRALGASKNDVSKIFNAETFIEGLVSGLLGIMTTLLLCIPINAIVSSLVGVDNIAQLPIQYSIMLIAISVILTLIAGFFPSRMAAKKDPVTALRSE